MVEEEPQGAQMPSEHVKYQVLKQSLHSCDVGFDFSYNSEEQENRTLHGNCFSGL